MLNVKLKDEAKMKMLIQIRSRKGKRRVIKGEVRTRSTKVPPLGQKNMMAQNIFKDVIVCGESGLNLKLT